MTATASAGPLLADIGHSSHAGQRSRNEDFVGAAVPTGPILASHGVLAVVADGVSGHTGGREAAEYAARGLLTDYYATPETWEPSQALDKVLTAINRWVHAQGQSKRELQGMATTLTAVMLRGRSYAFAHVGDCRLMRLRAEQLTVLTTDHVWDRPDMQHVLTRAIGLEQHVVIDHGMGSLQQGDVYLLCSDGVWGTLTHYDTQRILVECARGKSAEQAAHDLTDLSLKEGSQDNVSAVVVRIDALGEIDARDGLVEYTDLPALPALKPEQVFDGLEVIRLLHQNDATQVALVRDLSSDKQYVLKALQASRANDPAERAAFAHEEWIAKRVVARFFAQYIPWPARNHLYFLTTWHEGSTLAALIEHDQHITIPQVLQWGVQIARALGALHRRSVLHRDIKPQNIHIGQDGLVRILDFGIAVSGADPGLAQRTPRAGTPSYLAPELFEESNTAGPTAQTDLYAAGVTLYYALTRRYPYGEVEPFQRPRFGEPTPPTRYRPEIPMWLENLLLKAVAKDPAERFETAEELLVALERAHSGNNEQSRSRRAPLAQRLPLRFWQIGLVVSLVLNLLLLLWLFAR